MTNVVYGEDFKAEVERVLRAAVPAAADSNSPGTYQEAVEVVETSQGELTVPALVWALSEALCHCANVDLPDVVHELIEAVRWLR